MVVFEGPEVPVRPCRAVRGGETHLSCPLHSNWLILSGSCLAFSAESHLEGEMRSRASNRNFIEGCALRLLFSF